MEMCKFYRYDEFIETFNWISYEVPTTILAPPRVPHSQNYTSFRPQKPDSGITLALNGTILKITFISTKCFANKVTDFLITQGTK